MKNEQDATRLAKRPRPSADSDSWSDAVETCKLPLINTLYPVCHSGGKLAARGFKSRETWPSASGRRFDTVRQLLFGPGSAPTIAAKFHCSRAAMSFNPLAPVTDYQSMLNRIFWFTSASSLAAIWMMRLFVPALDASFDRMDLALGIEGAKALPISGGYLLPALAIGIVTRIFRLHARVSDWLGIRETFDVEVILAEFADRLAINLESVGDETFRRARHRVMRQAFYPFVSGPQPAIDQQLIQQALDAWSWFWVGVEAILIFTLASFTLIAFHAYQIGFQTLAAATAAALLGLPAQRNQCKRYAIAQVRAILADPQRAAAVRGAFAELTGEPSVRRRAA